jgi:hypothetical protein
VRREIKSGSETKKTRKGKKREGKREKEKCTWGKKGKEREGGEKHKEKQNRKRFGEGGKV